MVKKSSASVEHVYSHHYLRGLCSQRTIYASPNPGLSSRAACGSVLHDYMNDLTSIHCYVLFSFSFLCLCVCSVEITIYYYKSNTEDKTFRGLPVVLNFSESNCFLRCCKSEEKVFLQVEVSMAERVEAVVSALYMFTHSGYQHHKKLRPHDVNLCLYSGKVGGWTHYLSVRMKSVRRTIIHLRSLL